MAQSLCAGLLGDTLVPEVDWQARTREKRKVSDPEAGLLPSPSLSPNFPSVEKHLHARKVPHPRTSWTLCPKRILIADTSLLVISQLHQELRPDHLFQGKRLV